MLPNRKVYRYHYDGDDEFQPQVVQYNQPLAKGYFSRYNQVQAQSSSPILIQSSQSESQPEIEQYYNDNPVHDPGSPDLEYPIFEDSLESYHSDLLFDYSSSDNELNDNSISSHNDNSSIDTSESEVDIDINYNEFPVKQAYPVYRKRSYPSYKLKYRK